MDGLTLVESVTGTWGPAALIAVAIALFFMGKIVSERTVLKLLASKDEQLATQKSYYEGRIADIKSGHSERMDEVRKSRDTLSEALQGAIDNVTKLIAQVEELQELTRAATPVMVAQRAAAEDQNG